MTGETDGGDARMLAKQWLSWVAVSTVAVTIGLGVKTELWPGIGESIVMVGLLSFLASITKLIHLIAYLPLKWQFAVFGVFGIMIVVLGCVLYRYVPYTFGILVRFSVMASVAFAGIGVCMLGEAVFEKIRVDSEGDT